MRLTIIPSDGLVIKDGIAISGLDLSFMDSDIHALQWYGAHGELEIKNEFGKIVENREIISINKYQQAVDMWEAAKIVIDNSKLPDK